MVPVISPRITPPVETRSDASAIQNNNDDTAMSDVHDTARALFDVDDYAHYVAIQSESAIRHLASSYPYDHPEDHGVSLRGSMDEVARALQGELRVGVAQFFDNAVKVLKIVPYPRNVFLSSASVDYKKKIVFAKPMDDHIVDKCARRIEHRRIMRLSNR